MSNPVIKVQNLGKLYKIGALQDRHDTLRDQLAHAFTAPFQRLRRKSQMPLNPPSSFFPHPSEVACPSAFAVAAHLEPEILLVDESLP